jgi:hypothetical protein
VWAAQREEDETDGRRPDDDEALRAMRREAGARRGEMTHDGTKAAARAIGFHGWDARWDPRSVRWWTRPSESARCGVWAPAFPRLSPSVRDRNLGIHEMLLADWARKRFPTHRLDLRTTRSHCLPFRLAPPLTPHAPEAIWPSPPRRPSRSPLAAPPSRRVARGRTASREALPSSEASFARRPSAAPAWRSAP